MGTGAYIYTVEGAKSDKLEIKSNNGSALHTNRLTYKQQIWSASGIHNCVAIAIHDPISHSHGVFHFSNMDYDSGGAENTLQQFLTDTDGILSLKTAVYIISERSDHVLQAHQALVKVGLNQYIKGIDCQLVDSKTYDYEQNICFTVVSSQKTKILDDEFRVVVDGTIYGKAFRFIPNTGEIYKIIYN